jgi:hypothetical protein
MVKATARESNAHLKQLTIFEVRFHDLGDAGWQILVTSAICSDLEFDSR